MPPEAAEASASTESTATPATPAAAPSSGGGSTRGALEGAIAKAVAMGGDDDGDEAEVETIEKPAAPAPAAKGAAKKEPTRRVEKLEAKAAEKQAEAPPAPEPEAALAKARYHLQHGDVAKAIDSAFGDLKSISAELPDAVREALARKLGIGSANWEKFRKHEANARRELHAREQKLVGVVEQLKQEYGPLHSAREAYAKGDYDAAFKAAFGEDAADFQRKVISQRVGKDPELEKLRAQIEADKAERAEERRRWEQQQREASERQQIAEYQHRLQGELSESDDPLISKYASKPNFVARVFEVLRENYDPSTGVTVPVRIAAEHVRDQIQAALQDWSVDHPGLAPATAAQASEPPAKPPVRPARTLKQTSAAEASGQPRKLTREEIRSFHQRKMEQLPAET